MAITYWPEIADMELRIGDGDIDLFIGWIRECHKHGFIDGNSVQAILNTTIDEEDKKSRYHLLHQFAKKTTENRGKWETWVNGLSPDDQIS